jgi:hypothetical protein
MYNIKDFEYLNYTHNTTPTEIYKGASFQLFQTDEFEKKTRPIDWVSIQTVQKSIDFLVAMIDPYSMTVDFGNESQNKFITRHLNESGYNAISKAITNDLVTGDGYVQLAVEDDSKTREEDISLYSYEVNPYSVYQKYDVYNPARGATAYSLLFSKKKDSIEYLLVVTYTPGYITYEAYKNPSQKPKKVDPKEYFPEFFSDTQTYTEENLTYTLDLELDYSALTHFQSKREQTTSYGESMITDAVSSKVQLIERMYNLADYAVTNNAKPRFQMSKETSRILSKAIADMKQTENYSVTQLPVSFSQAPNAKVGVTYEFSQVAQRMGNNLLYFGDDGVGENKYIVNPYRLDDLYLLIEKSMKELYSDLYISEAVWNPDLASGNLSGAALRRLMIQTTTIVEHKRKAYIQEVQTLPSVAQQARLLLQHYYY